MVAARSMSGRRRPSRKIADTVRTLELNRFDLKYSKGPMPHAQSMRAIELYGTRVIPLVRDILAD